MSNILVLTPWFPNVPDGWPARFISDSSQALAEENHNVNVAVFRGWVPPGLSALSGKEHRGKIQVEEFDSIDEISLSLYLHLPRGILRRLTMWSLDMAVKRELKKQLEKNVPDLLLVHTEMLAPAVVAFISQLDIPVFVVLHGQNTNTKYLESGCQAERFRSSLGAVDRLLIVGEPLREYAAKLSGRSDHIDVVWNGVDAPLNVLGERSDNDVKLVTVANLQEGKGVDLLIAGLAELYQQGHREWNLEIIGSGPQENELKNQVHALGLQSVISFLGNKTNKEVFLELSGKDIFILPSYREAFGIVYAEAMSMGLLTIGVKGQGPEQFILDGKTGFLLEPCSISSIVDRLRWVFESERSSWLKIAEKGELMAREELTWEAHATRITELAESVVSDNADREFKKTVYRPSTPVMVVMIEPAPYMVSLSNELVKAWPNQVDTFFLSSGLTQPWGEELDTSHKVMPIGVLSVLKTIWCYFNYSRPKIVFVAGWGNPKIIMTILMAKFFGARVVAMSDTWQSSRKGVIVFFKKNILKLIDRFTPGGNRQAEYLSKLGVDSSHIFTAGMTVDTENLQRYIRLKGRKKRAELRSQLGLGDDVVLFLFLGRLELVKGPDIAVESFLEANLGVKGHLLIVGDGSMRAELERQVGTSCKVTLKGRLEGDELMSCFAAADVFLATSRHEPWGLVVNEAMASGLPIIASDCFGCIGDLILDKKNALVVPTANVAVTSNAINDLVDSPKKRLEMGEASKEFIQGWTSESWAKGIVLAWKDILRS